MRTRKILFIVMMFLTIVLFYTLLNQIVTAAYNMSQWVTSGQVQKAEELGAIERTTERTTERTLEVVNNYGEQETIDTNQLQGSRNEN